MTNALLFTIIGLQIVVIAILVNMRKKKAPATLGKELDFEGRKTFKILSQTTVGETEYYTIADMSNPQVPKVGILCRNDVFNSENDNASNGLSMLKTGSLYLMSNAPISAHHKGEKSKVFAEKI